MRIDFLARYKQVSEYIKSPAEPDTSAVARNMHAESLADFAPQFLQSTEINQEKQSQLADAASFRMAPDDVRAQLNITKPEMVSPQFEPFTGIIGEQESDKELVLDVKTPTIVSIERTRSTGLGQTNSESIATVKTIVEKAGEHFGVDPTLGMAVVARESSFNPQAVSSDGHQSKGLFQLLDRTGKDLLKRLGMEREYNPFDPEQNVYLGVSYLRHLRDIFSKQTELPNKATTVVAANNASLEKLAVAAFNAGEGRVASAQQRALQAGKDPSQYSHVEDYLPESTQQYVAKVLEAKAQFTGPLSAPIISR